MKAWLMQTGEITDQRALNQRSPNFPVSVETLRDLGLLHWTMNPATMLVPNPETGKSEVDELCEEHGYKNRDEVRCCPQHLENYEEKIKMFFQEHIHEDDEIRLIKDGIGFFDVRDKNDEWVRIQVTAGDLIVVPAGIYHRFTMDETDNTHAIRIFKEVPKWTPINRPCEENEYRKAFLATYVPAPKRVTIMGEALEEKNDMYYIHYPDTYDEIMIRAIKTLDASKGDMAVVYYAGNHNPSTKKSWCPDCVRGDPRVIAGIEKLRETRRVVFIYAPVEFTTYFSGDDFALSKHPFAQLSSGVPTLQVLKAKAPVEGDGGYSVDVVGRFADDDVPEDWVEKL